MAKQQKLTEDEVNAVLKSMNRVLKNKNIAQSVTIQFEAANTSLCWRRICTPMPDGSQRCSWQQVPC